MSRGRVPNSGTLANEHRHASDNEALNQPCTQEPFNRDPTVDVEVVSTAGSKLRNDLSRRSGHLFHHATGPGQVDGATTQDHHAFARCRPSSGIPGCRNETPETKKRVRPIKPHPCECCQLLWVYKQ